MGTINIAEIFEKIGIGSETFTIRLGRGVVGKMAGIVLIAILVLGGLALQVNWWPVTAGVAVAIFVLVVLAFYYISLIARERPEVALLEGAEFLLYHQRIALATKSLPNPPKTEELQSDPSVPLLESPETPEGKSEESR